jgi:hypothetical protein
MNNRSNNAGWPKHARGVDLSTSDKELILQVIIENKQYL